MFARKGSSRCTARPRVLRLEDRVTPTAGMLDPTFGGDGRVTTRFPIPSDDRGSSIAVDSLGRIVIAGYTANGSNIGFAIARFTPAGALDPSFGGTGAVTFTSSGGGYAAFVDAVAVDSLDRVVVAGGISSFGGTDFMVMRLTEAGALDSGFGVNGRQIVGFLNGHAGGLRAPGQADAVGADSPDRGVFAGRPIGHI